MILEVCIENATRIDEMISKKVRRVELCDNLAIGGTTVSYGVAENVIKRCHDNDIAVMAMLRPRGGNFIYSPFEINIMQKDAEMLINLGVDGLVFGCLLANGQLDIANNALLLHAAGDTEKVFHMAFDHIDPAIQLKSLDWLADNKFTRILTHGSADNNDILDNATRITQYIEKAAKRIEILPGGGITKDNYIKVLSTLNVTQAHGTRIV